jgi:hypothetical protein
MSNALFTASLGMRIVAMRAFPDVSSRITMPIGWPVERYVPNGTVIRVTFRLGGIPGTTIDLSGVHASDGRSMPDAVTPSGPGGFRRRDSGKAVSRMAAATGPSWRIRPTVRPGMVLNGSVTTGLRSGDGVVDGPGPRRDHEVSPKRTSSAQVATNARRRRPALPDLICGPDLGQELTVRFGDTRIPLLVCDERIETPHDSECDVPSR